MAEVALNSVIKKVVDVAGNLIVEESSRLYWLKEDMRWLENQLRHMQAYQQVADAKQLIDPRVATLIKQIRDLAHDADDILEDFLPKIESYRSRGFITKTATLLPYGRTSSKFSGEIEKIKRRIEEIDATRKTYGIPDIDAAGVERVLTIAPRIVALHVDDPVVLGLDKDIADLKKKLLSEEEGLLFVAVVGMAGVGKTTLAKKVFKSVKEQFSCSALISISQQPNVKDMLNNIAEQVGLAENNRKNNLEANLYAFLESNRYVLLLDDIWSQESWEGLRVGIPTTNCVNGSKIIITSRFMDVGRYICGGERSLHKLNVLDSPTSWNLFNELIMPTLTEDNQGFESPCLKEIGEEIVRQCGGLPLAIVVTVGMLRAKGTSEEKWKEVLQSIRTDIDDKCSQILASSYKDLPSKLKPCFLYLAAFPEDYEVRVSELVRLWMAEKFIEGCKGSEPEDVGEMYVNELVSRNLIQVVSRKHNGRVQRVRIHDLLHSLCINTAREINFLHITLDNQSHGSGTKRRRLSAHKGINEVFNSDDSVSGIRTLHVFSTREENSRKNQRRLMCSKKMQVLSIRDDSLGVGIKASCQPKYLKFKGEERVHLSKQNFKNLQTLDLRGLGDDALIIPNVVWQMKQLRHLILKDQEIARVATCCGGDVSLPNLRTLGWVYFIDIDFIGPDTFPNLRKFGVYINDSDLLKKLSGQVPISSKLEVLWLLDFDPPFTRRSVKLCTESMRSVKLTPESMRSVRRRAESMRCVRLTTWNRSSYEAKWTGADIEETFNLSRYNNLTKLGIYQIKLGRLPGIDQFPPNLLKLTLYRNELEEDPMQVLKKHPKLKILLLVDLYFGRKLDCSGADSFPQLEVLHLKGLHNLEEVIDGEEGGMHKLREFIVRGCDKLERCPEWLQQLRREE